MFTITGHFARIQLNILFFAVEKSIQDVQREAKLLELLVDIMEQKNRLIESKIDPTAAVAANVRSGGKSWRVNRGRHHRFNVVVSSRL